MVLTHRTGFPNWREGKLDIKFTPGTQALYSGEGFVYLGKVVEKLTGKKLVDLCREEAFAPLGIENASLVWNDNVARLTAAPHAGRSPLSKGRPGAPNVAASLHIDAGNYAKFLIAVLQGKGLSEAISKEMLRPQSKVPDHEKASWGLGIAIERTPFGVTYGHGGKNTGFTSNSIMLKDGGLGYVVLVNNDDVKTIDNALLADLIAGKSVLDDSKPVARKLAKVDPKVYDAYVGRYEISPSVILAVTREGDRLMAQATNEGKSEVFPNSETVFFLRPTSDDTATFVKDDNGSVTHVVLHREGRDAKAIRLGGGIKADEAK
jgi:CubicO group peptidase (beta-lactamase class C family)